MKLQPLIFLWVFVDVRAFWCGLQFLRKKLWCDIGWRGKSRFRVMYLALTLVLLYHQLFNIFELSGSLLLLCDDSVK